MTRDEELRLISEAIASGKLQRCPYIYESTKPFNYNKAGFPPRPSTRASYNSSKREEQYRKLGLI